MNILYVCKSLPHSFQGGIQTHVWKLSEYMMKLGHHVTILTAGSWRKGEKRYDLDGRNIIELPYVPMRHFALFSEFLEELSFNIAASKWLSKNTEGVYDIVHLQGRSGFMFPKKNNRVPIISTFHGLLEIENSKSKKFGIQSFIHEKWATYYERNALSNSNASIAVSQEMYNSIECLSPKSILKACIISNGVEVQNIEPQHFNKEIKTLLFVGRLSRIKGIYNFITALKSIQPGIWLVIIGDGEERKRLEKHIATEGVSNQVTLLGALPNEAVLKWIKKSEALILPSFHETQGIVLLEANACGKPVIASNIGGIKEVVQDGFNGLLCNPNEPLHIAETINRLFENPKLMEELGKNGQEMVGKKYSWSIIAEITESLYFKTIKQFNTENRLQNVHYQSVRLA